MELYQYKRTAHYYETDQMGVIHHSNYIRWFEEARIHMMAYVGFSYEKMETLGIFSPVTSVQCTYKSAVKFGDTVLIMPMIKEFNGVKMTVAYEITDLKKSLLYTTGESRHCFINEEGKLLSLKKSHKDIYDIFNTAYEINAKENELNNKG